MASLQQKASEWSGVAPEDAFAIDEGNLFEKLGLQPFIDLSTAFYNRYPRAAAAAAASLLIFFPLLGLSGSFLLESIRRAQVLGMD